MLESWNLAHKLRITYYNYPWCQRARTPSSKYQVPAYRRTIAQPKPSPALPYPALHYQNWRRQPAARNNYQFFFNPSLAGHIIRSSVWFFLHRNLRCVFKCQTKKREVDHSTMTRKVVFMKNSVSLLVGHKCRIKCRMLRINTLLGKEITKYKLELCLFFRPDLALYSWWLCYRYLY